jgi:hypothetical protein
VVGDGGVRVAPTRRGSGARALVPDEPDGRHSAAEELTALLDVERAGATQPLLQALLELRGGDVDSGVGAAADSLLLACAPWSLDYKGPLARIVQALGDDVSRRVFTCRSLARHGQPTLATLAGRLGISQKRLGRIAHRAEAMARAALADAAPPLPWVVAAVRRRLGRLTTEQIAESTTAGYGVRRGPDADLVLWLAGPYPAVPGRPGWLATDATEVIARTMACLSTDGGVRRLADVERELGDIGVAAGQVIAWLGSGWSTVVDDLVVAASGSLPDVIERVLDASGRVLGLSEIVAFVAGAGPDAPFAGFEAALRSRRFRRAAGDRFALAEWIPEGAEAPPASAMRREDMTAQASPDGRLWLWIRVDADVLRGAEAVVPAALVEGLGLGSGCRCTFSSRYGPIGLAHDSPHTRGSVRPVALAAGAREGDTLLLGFSAAGDVAVDVRRAAGQDDEQDGSRDTAIFPESMTSGAR